LREIADHQRILRYLLGQETKLDHMTETNKVSTRHHSMFKRAFLSLRLRFTLHEAWALRNAEKLPLFSIFVFGTLWVWFFIPALFFGVPLTLLLVSLGPLGNAIYFSLGFGGMVFLVPWFFRWYFICLGLMFGSGTLARAKEKEISSRLQRFQSLLN
jgi:cell division protein FtsW (lipid II flippase)